MIEPSQEISMLNMFNNCQNVEMFQGAYRETQKGGGAKFEKNEDFLWNP